MRFNQPKFYKIKSKSIYYNLFPYLIKSILKLKLSIKFEKKTCTIKLILTEYRFVYERSLN